PTQERGRRTPRRILASRYEWRRLEDSGTSPSVTLAGAQVNCDPEICQGNRPSKGASATGKSGRGVGRGTAVGSAFAGGDHEEVVGVVAIGDEQAEFLIRDVRDQGFLDGGG